MRSSKAFCDGAVALGNLDRFPGASVVAVGIGAARAVIGDVDASLRVILAVESICVFQSAQHLVVDDPLQLLFCPYKGVVVNCASDVVDIVVDRSVVRGCVALAEIVCLDACVVSTQPFPINFIKVIGFENNRGDDTDAGSGFHHNADLTEEDVETVVAASTTAAVLRKADMVFVVKYYNEGGHKVASELFVRRAEMVFEMCSRAETLYTFNLNLPRRPVPIDHWPSLVDGRRAFQKAVPAAQGSCLAVREWSKSRGHLYPARKAGARQLLGARLRNYDLLRDF
ncbi:hypothetical protein KCU93_g404, partial [Aureobasidium melanogenum]